MIISFQIIILLKNGFQYGKVRTKVFLCYNYRVHIFLRSQDRSILSMHGITIVLTIVFSIENLTECGFYYIFSNNHPFKKRFHGHEVKVLWNEVHQFRYCTLTGW